MSHNRIKPKQIMMVLLVLLLLFGSIYLISYVYWTSKAIRYPIGLESYPDKGKYKINPETILTSLDRGETDVFVPISVPIEESYRLFSPGSFSWRQSNYFKISSSTHHYVWEEKLDDWRLSAMHFSGNCLDNPNGFDGGEITFFKPTSDGSSYETRLIIISPLWGEVEWGGSAFYPHPPLFGWKSIDLDRLEVTADDALQIAEENGGQEIRKEVGNSCTVKIILSPNTDSGYVWRVYYFPGYPYYDAETFEINIDPYTGHYEIFSTGK